MVGKDINEITLEDAKFLEPKRKFVPYEDDFSDEDIDIANPRKKSKVGALKPGSPINMQFIPEAQHIPDNDLAVAVHELKNLCRKKRIPVFVYAEITEKNGTVTDFITSEEMNLPHKENDEILQHIKISRGFTAVEKNTSINVDELNL